MDMIDVDLDVEDQNEVSDNFVDDDSAPDDDPFNNEGNEDEYISSNDNSD